MLLRCFTRRFPASASILATALLLAPSLALADEAATGAIRFQKPNRPGSSTAKAAANLQFRSASTKATAVRPVEPATEPVATQDNRGVLLAAKPLAPPRQASATKTKAPDPSFLVDQAEVIDETPLAAQPRRPRHPNGSIIPTILEGHAEQIGYCAGCAEPECGVVDPGCGMEVSCGVAEPGCGIVEPGCGTAEPDCGIVEPECGVVEPGCGYEEPSCGVDGVDCGSCVGRGGADYWCFPVCFPRFKELTLWGGVHGFKGPRDSPAFGGDGDGNFGFQEGVNVGGRAPLIGLLFPQLGFQLSYQAVQSQLSGTSGGSSNDRSQNFVTAGLFRHVPAGVQFGAVWDHMSDDFQRDAEFDQIRYEVSLKGRSGREIGFWGATSVSDDAVGATVFETVDQYVGFVRYNFQGGGMGRLWGGATGDKEGLFGGDFYVPFSNRWSLQSGFNYLITDQNSGSAGSRDESWNLGMNFVWHFGCTAKQSRNNPFMPLFPVADNGSMFIDRVQ